MRTMMQDLFPGLIHAPNLHPMVVHFPIAFWVAAAGIWVVAVSSQREKIWRFGLWMQSMGLAGAAIAVGFGFWASEQLGHDSPGHEFVHVHRDFMLVATGLAVLITVIGWWSLKRRHTWRLGLAVAALILAGITSLGADRGAELVFRYGVGVAMDQPAQTDGHNHDHGAHDAPSTAGGHHDAPTHGH
jgi:uncharacterized membrane protein